MELAVWRLATLEAMMTDQISQFFLTLFVRFHLFLELQRGMADWFRCRIGFSRRHRDS